MDDWIFFLDDGIPSDMQQSAGERAVSHPDDIIRLIAVDDPETASRAVRGLNWIYPTPDGAESALRVMLAGITASVIEWNANLTPDDPDNLVAETIRNRYYRWRAGWERVLNGEKRPVPPELQELSNLLDQIMDTPGLQEANEIDTLRSAVQYDIQEWSASPDTADTTE